MCRLIFVAAIVLCAGCARSEESSATVVLNVSASNQLQPFDIRPASSSTGYAHDLVYLQPDRYHLERPSATEAALFLTDPPPALEAFCNTLCIRGNPRVTSRGDHCLIAFDSAQAMSRFTASSWLEIGPFWLQRQVPEHPQGEEPVSEIVLEDRCDVTRIDEIHIRAMHTNEEWKSLSSGEIHVIPSTSISNVDRLQQVGSIHLELLPIVTDVALHFNTRRAPWSDRDLRRTVALAVEPRAVANVACDLDEACQITAPPAFPPEVETSPQGDDSLMVLATESNTVRAATAIAYHWHRRFHRELDIRKVDIDPLNAHIRDGDFALFLAPLPRFDSSQGLERVRQKIEFLTGYDDEEFQRAVRSGDIETAQALLRRDVPVVRLYAYRRFTAIDARFHLPEDARTPSQNSWRWMADLVPAEQKN